MSRSRPGVVVGRPPEVVPTTSRRVFLKLTGASGGLAVLATRPARAGPKKPKTLTDRGRASDRLTVPAGRAVWPPTWPAAWPEVT